MERQHARLEKQEEFEVEEENFLLSPVTIQIEDRGCNPSNEDLEGENLSVLDEDSSSREGSFDHSIDRTDKAIEYKHEKRRSSRVKLLVRSHAVQDDASPPPDIDTVITNTNMLCVTNVPSFATQSKGSSNKIRLGNQSSSQGSTESSSTSGLSRDSSTETYTDFSGIDLQQFIVDTLHKNQKDRLMLLKVEQEMALLVKDSKRVSMKFPQMSSYNRMLVHRVAAFFGLDHYVDGNGTAVIVNKTKTTRMPDSRFHDLIRDELLPEEPKKSILKRDSISFEEGKEQKSPERQSSSDSRRSKSFEEREEEYEKARARIFNKDEGLGESPLNRSQEGTYCSSHRSSQEDVRWPSSETRPWSSTDSDSSGRPLCSKFGSSFESEITGQSNKVCRNFAKIEAENKAFLLSTKSVRPVMTKASSFGGISVLSRENSIGRSFTPRIRKAESFNVTTISSSPIESSCNVPFSHEEDGGDISVNVGSSAIDMLKQFPPYYDDVSSDEKISRTFDDPVEHQVTCIQDSSQNITHWQSTSVKNPPNDFNLQPGQPLMWPYSTGSNILFPGVFVNPSTGYQRLQFSSYPTSSFCTTEPITDCTISPGSTSSSNNQSLHRPYSSSLQIQQPQGLVNTSSPQPPVIYVPCISQVQTSTTQQSCVTSAQNVRHQAQSTSFVAEPRPLILFPVCYMPHTSTIHPVFSKSSPQQTALCTITQSTGLNISSVGDAAITDSQHCSALPYTKSGEAAVSAPVTAVISYGGVNAGILNPAPYQSLFSNQQITQPILSVEQPQLQSVPVYVSVTNSTQSPATCTQAGGHAATQFSSMRSYSLPVSSSSLTPLLPHPIPHLSFTVTVTQPLFLPSPPAFPMLPSSTPRINLLQYPVPITSLGKSPLSFPLVKQASDPGVAAVASSDHLTLSSLFLGGSSGHPNARPFLLPHQPTIPRFPHAPTIRPGKTRKHRSKSNSSISSGATFQEEGKCTLEISGLPEDRKLSELEETLKILTELGAKIYFLNAENLKILDEKHILISSNKHLVLAVFDTDTAASNALLGTKTYSFRLCHWKHSQVGEMIQEI